MDEYVFRLPDVGEGTAEAEIVAWHVAVGDRIEEDGLLVDVMTDKATVEMTSPVDGVVKALHGEIGEMAAVGAPLAVIETEGASQAASPRSTAAASVEILRPPAPPTTAPKPSPRPPKPPPGREPPSIKRPDGEPPPMRLVARAPGAKPLASPAVRRRAVELGAPLQQVAGSGPAGRLTMADLEAFIQNPAPRTPRAGPARREGAEEVKVLGLRRRIAERMADSKRRIPHFAYVEEVDVTELEALRVHLNASRPDAPRLSALALLVLALVKTLPDFPQINATFDDEAGFVHRHRPVHVGI
ncbi:MAG: 2-oxo acid dehydrogenase subunit E2, partial [Caulobacteraceae bacterium]